MSQKVKCILLCLVLAFCYSLAPALVTHAEDTVDNCDNALKDWSEEKLRRYAEDNILYYDDQFKECENGEEEEDECPPGSTNINIDSSDNIGYIMSKLKAVGYNITSIAAIMGNLKGENSTHNPRLLEKALPDGSYTVPDGFIAYDLSKDGQEGKTYNGGLGIAQWTYWNRVRNLQIHADNLGQPVYSIEAQASFLAEEIQGYITPSALNALSMEEATKKVLFDFENPENKSQAVQDKRYGYAKEYYTRLLGENPDEPVNPNPELVICPEKDDDNDGGGGNWNNDDIQKYIYLQGDPEWGNLNYGPDGINGKNGTTIKESGCGPSSFATIISIIKNQRITPKETADIAGRGGQHCYKDGEWCGSNHSITSYLANYYGVNAQAINISIESIQTALDSGKMIHIVGSGSLPFSANGHYVAIIKSDNDKWWVANSGYAAHKWEAYDPITIVSNARYAVAVWE